MFKIFLYYFSFKNWIKFLILFSLVAFLLLSGISFFNNKKEEYKNLSNNSKTNVVSSSLFDISDLRGEKVWEWFQTNDRLFYLQQNEFYSISDIWGGTSAISLKPLWNINHEKKYDDLDLTDQNFIEGTISPNLFRNNEPGEETNKALKNKEEMLQKIWESKFWYVLQTKNRWLHIKKNRISSIDGVNVNVIHNLDDFPDKLSKLLAEDKYSNLKNLLNAFLEQKFKPTNGEYNFAKKIDQHIVSKISESDAWTFLTTNDRLKNIQKFKIKQINNVVISNLFKIDSNNQEYSSLDEETEILLFGLDNSSFDYQAKTDELINNAKTQSRTAWTWLQKDDRLIWWKKRKPYILNWNPNTSYDLAILWKMNPKIKYENLNDNDKRFLFNFQRDILNNELSQKLILIQIEKIKLWLIFRQKERWNNIKKYQITHIDGIYIEQIWSMDLNLSDKFEDLTFHIPLIFDTIARKKLNSSSGNYNYEAKIDKTINEAKANVWIKKLLKSIEQDDILNNMILLDLTAIVIDNKDYSVKNIKTFTFNEKTTFDSIKNQKVKDEIFALMSNNIVFSELKEEVLARKKARSTLLLNAFKKKDSFFNKMKNDNTISLTIDDKTYYFVELFKVDWSKPDVLEKLPFEAKQEFNELYELVNKKDKTKKLENAYTPKKIPFVFSMELIIIISVISFFSLSLMIAFSCFYILGKRTENLTINLPKQ